MIQRTDLRSDMEVNESQQDRVQLLSEKRKWQTEIENKKRQLEDDKRALQHLKSKALRERWLLDGAPSSGPEQDDVRRQLEQDETRTLTLEDNIHRLEEELLSLETGSVCQTIIHTAVCSGSVKAVGVKGQPERAATTAAAQIAPEVRVPKSPRVSAASEESEEMKRAMYSVEIKVERDRLTGETRVLSTNTTLPVDFSQRGVKVYEDERKVVHEMNGEDGVQLLSVSEVEDLIHKADEASVMSQTVATVTSLPTAEAAATEEQASPETSLPAEIRGLRAEPGGERGLADASATAPLTMVFMGYQSVEDEDETKKVFGLVGTVTAERVLIDDHVPSDETSPSASQEAPPTHATKKPTEMATAPVGNGEPADEGVREGKEEMEGKEGKDGKDGKERKDGKDGKEGKEGKDGKEGKEEKEGKEGVEEVKEKKPCKCCSIM
ncbi:paralemmin 1a isoform X2 [Sander lucioperca]|uniref:paralemmin 1a isoform X2 n=1 Tax=Sander lucioperca TaxID=283035 RepID=UPI00165368E3|nr:paralemmin 1a isoform X2 [Sander lucioperca]